MKTWRQVAQGTRDAVSPRTLVELLGKNRVLVEHHKGILRYGTEEILVGASYGILRICGDNLRLCCMSREQLYISGEILSVHLEGRE